MKLDRIFDYACNNGFARARAAIMLHTMRAAANPANPLISFSGQNSTRSMPRMSAFWAKP